MSSHHYTFFLKTLTGRWCTHYYGKWIIN